MTAIMLAGGVLRVPDPSVLPDGTRVDATRDIAPDAPDYAIWLPYAIPRRPHGAAAPMMSTSWGGGEQPLAPDKGRCRCCGSIT